jgi:TrmH family RNA methyltransferase
MISIVLMEPENEGNIGAVARVMANFAQSRLVLVNPKADHLSGPSIARSKHAKEILQEAEVIGVHGLGRFDTLIATTSKLGSDYNLPRSPITPSDLAGILVDDEADIGILFGREGIGLTNAEIKKCDFILTIPSAPDYPALNLSHSVSIVCYELYKAEGEEGLRKRFRSIPAAEKKVILQKLDELFDTFDWKTPDKRRTQELFWKRLISKSVMTKREA